MSPSSTPNSSTFTTPVSTPPPEQTSPSKDLGILDYNGKKYKVTVIYTDETGKAVNGPEGIDQEKVHKLTKELLDEIPDIEQSAKITIDENCVTGGEAAIPHNPKTKEIWNNLYTELTTSKETKPSNDTSGLSTKVILEEVDVPKIDTETEENEKTHKRKFAAVLDQIASQQNPAKKQSAPTSPVEENSANKAPDVLVESPTTEKKSTADTSEDPVQLRGINDTEFLDNLNLFSTENEISNAHLKAEAKADSIKAETP